MRSLRARRRRTTAIGSARGWILTIGIAFAVFGTLFGLSNASEAKDAKRTLSKFEDSRVWPIEVHGRRLTVGELKEEIDSEVTLLFAANYALAAIMFGLWFWAGRAPLPAMVVALGVSLVVQVVNLVIDPTSLLSGWLIKILFVGALMAGLKDALAQRASAEQQAQSVQGAASTA